MLRIERGKTGGVILYHSYSPPHSEAQEIASRPAHSLALIPAYRPRLASLVISENQRTPVS